MHRRSNKKLSANLKSNTKFKVVFQFISEEIINNKIRRMKSNEEEKKGILLDEDKSSKEIDSIWMELTNNFFVFLSIILSFVDI